MSKIICPSCNHNVKIKKGFDVLGDYLYAVCSNCGSMAIKTPEDDDWTWFRKQAIDALVKTVKKVLHHE